MLGHGAGELLRAACRELLRAAAATRSSLARLAAAARAGRGGGRARRAGVAERGGDPRARRPRGHPRGAAHEPRRPDRRGAVAARRCATSAPACPDGVTVVVDEALGEFEPDGEDAAGLVAELPNLLVVRSFSKAHALAGLRAGAALGPRRAGRPARAERRHRRARAGRRRVGGRPSAGWRSRRGGAPPRPPRTSGWPRRWPARRCRRCRRAVPFAWISSDAEDGPAIAARLASRQVFVAPAGLWRDERHVRAALRGPAAIDRLVAALLDGPAERRTGSSTRAPISRRRIALRTSMKARESMGISVRPARSIISNNRS